MKQTANTRIVITGMGAITPIGTDVETYWHNLLKGKSGIRTITRYDASKMETRLAGEIHDFDPLAYLPKKLASRMALFTQYGYAAATQALQDSGITIEAPNRVGIVLGTALGGTAEIAEEQLRFEEAHL